MTLVGQRVKQHRERLRQRYRPRQVRLLFVGEAPPASGRFFYKANSGLYRAIRDVFTRVFPTVQKEDFLDSFCGLGCYLVDLCATPVDHLSNKQRKKARMKAEFRFSRVLKGTSPKILINVVKDISINVRRALELTNWKCDYIDLPYPGRWKHHRKVFERGLKAILRKEYVNQ